MGTRAVEEFTRFYLVPGAKHGPSETEFMPAWDAVTALDRWVVEGEAPRRPVVQGIRQEADRSRPLWPVPGMAEIRRDGQPRRSDELPLPPKLTRALVCAVVDRACRSGLAGNRALRRWL